MSRKKIGLLSMVMMLVLVLVTACGGKEKEISLGVTESGSYTNDYFGLSLTFPKEWLYQNADQMMELMAAGKDVIAGDDESKKKMLDLSKSKTLNLLVTSKFPVDSGKVGPSAIAVAEKVSLLQGVKDGKDYLEASKKLMVDSKLPYEFKDISTVKVGGKEMYTMQASINTGQDIVTQDYYSSIIDGYAFNLILTYIDAESKAETDKILESVTFK
ncbi:hypothetical protein J2Z22_001920 [Paenibacillus forsythiae]|uniref:PsbP C-terminal domain-containing protein n=1 Tax=Paenibacillus forsythiae TaxID=365616 RepID=A0ABU3H6H0_9BACL|nr:hypothetical protein [Paenibacillus forsythiae]MDT3426394.1 hypothetical protein [Paenibacillus forsythiae]